MWNQLGELWRGKFLGEESWRTRPQLQRRRRGPSARTFSIRPPGGAPGPPRETGLGGGTSPVALETEGAAAAVIEPVGLILQHQESATYPSTAEYPQLEPVKRGRETVRPPRWVPDFFKSLERLRLKHLHPTPTGPGACSTPKCAWRRALLLSFIGHCS